MFNKPRLGTTCETMNLLSGGRASILEQNGHKPERGAEVFRECGKHRSLRRPLMKHHLPLSFLSWKSPQIAPLILSASTSQKFSMTKVRQSAPPCARVPSREVIVSSQPIAVLIESELQVRFGRQRNMAAGMQYHCHQAVCGTFDSEPCF